MVGRSTISLNSIGFGTWAWGNKTVWGYDSKRDDIRLSATFRQAISSGLNLIDTADSYGTASLNGRSEALLGQFISELPATRRSQLTVATKLAPFPWRWGHRAVNASFEASRTRLRGHLHRVQLHWSTSRYAPWQEHGLLEGLAELVLAGRVEELGLSNLGPKRLRSIHRLLLERDIRLRSVQVQCSLLAPAHDQLCELIAFSRDIGVEVLAYSPLALGVLACAPGSEERRPVTWLRRRLFQRLLPASLELRSAMQAIAIDRGASMVQVALNWCRALAQRRFRGCELQSRPGMSPLRCSGHCHRRSFSGWMRPAPLQRADARQPFQSL